VGGALGGGDAGGSAGRRFGARDPYAWLHPGGALQLEAALALAARLDGRTGHDPGALDFERAPRAIARSPNAIASRCASCPRFATGSGTPSATRGGASARPHFPIRCRARCS
jgi:hypothetical protein